MGAPIVGQRAFCTGSSDFRLWRREPSHRMKAPRTSPLGIGRPRARMPSTILQIQSGPASVSCRRDARQAPRPGARDGVWIAVTSLLEHASLAGANGPALVPRAIDIAVEALGSQVVQHRGDREWRDNRTRATPSCSSPTTPTTPTRSTRRLTMVTALDRAERGLNAVQRGRLLARRARYLSRLGRLEEAADHFRTVGQLGKHANERGTARAGVVGARVGRADERRLRRVGIAEPSCAAARQT